MRRRGDAVTIHDVVQTLSQIRQLLDERGIKPKHRLGQNFLHDKNQLTKLLDAAQVTSGDLVLEVGPGTGTLTSALLERGAQVIACEIDHDMAAIIREVFEESTALTLIQADALEKGRRLNSAIVDALNGKPFKLVANLPYQIASPLMSALLIDHRNCLGEFVTIQKEVADRLLAAPGTKEYGPLSIIVQAFGEVKRIGTLAPSCFWPPPEVTSAMVAITPREDSAIPHRDRREFARFTTDLFTKRRKQLGTIFGRQREQWPSGVTPDLRPEALSPQQVIALWKMAGPAGE